MPYEPILINTTTPPEDLNTAAWNKANANFEDIADALGAPIPTGLLSARPAAGNAGAVYLATDAPATFWVDDGAAWKATLTFGTTAGSACQGNDSRLSDSRAPTTHASGHITGASDEIDGDKLNIDWDATNYTPATVTDYSTNADDLTSHLKGIDTAIGGKQASLGYTAENTANKNAASGYCGLDAGGRVATAQLPDTVLGALQYKGVHDCSTAAYPVGPETGDYYVASVQGTISTTLYRAGDWLVYDGAAWGKIDNATVVSSVAGKTGAVTLNTADVADSSDKRYCTDAQKVVIGNTSGTNSGNETTTTVGALINSATVKTAPVDADYLGLMDSESSNPSNILKKLSWSYVKSVLKTYFDGLYTLANLGGVPTSRTVAGHALTGNVSISATDVGLGNVTNAAQLTTTQLGAALGVASLNISSKVVEDPANATASPTASKIPIADAAGKLAAGWGGAASTLATLNSSSKVVEEPASKAQSSGIASLDSNSLVVQNPASSIISITAGEAISQYDLLYANAADSGKYYVASNEDELTYDVKGIALAAIELGASGLIRVASGAVSNVGWAWTPGATLYCGVDGAIIEDIDDVEWVKAIGHADTATKIVFAPQLGYNIDDPVVEVNGDTLEVNYNPTGYSAPEVRQLAAHLAKISDKLVEFEGRIAAIE